LLLDFAVGAPYAGLLGRGAVYIYQGSATGVRKEFTQVCLIKMYIHIVPLFHLAV